MSMSYLLVRSASIAASTDVTRVIVGGLRRFCCAYSACMSSESMPSSSNVYES